MSMCRTWIIWFLLACSLTTTASATTSALSPELDNYIESTMKEFNIPGLALAVINERGVMWSKGFGYRDVENQLPIDGDTLFAIGSTTKAMTAAGIGILVDQGLLEFDKPLVNYLTDFQLFDPITTSLITPRDLLGHTSGLPRHDLLWYGAPWSREELYSRLRYLEPSAGFRQKFQYQNLMYMTAGVLIERVTGESWESFTRKEILQPLGMTRTTLNLTETQIDPNYSKAYSGGRGRPAVSIPMRDISAVGPAGSVHSSVEEMAQWLRLQLQKGEWEGKPLISPKSLGRIHQATTYVTDAYHLKYPEFTDLHYGMGWMSSFYRGDRILFHNGGIDGFVTHVSFIPEKKLAVVAFANNGSFDSIPLALRAYDMILGHPQSDWVTKMNPQTPTPPDLPPTKALPQPTQSYIGSYSHPGYGDVTIKESQGQLVVVFNQFTQPLVHLGEGQFVTQEFRENFPMSFNFDSAGIANKLLWLLEPSLGKAIEFDRH